MSNLKHRQGKIHKKRQQSDRRSFIKEISSWYPLMLYRVNNLISVYPDTNRVGPILPISEFEEQRDSLPCLESTQGDVFENLQALMRKIPLPHIHHFKSTQNASFANIVSTSKNPYLSFSVTGDSEDVLYSMSAKIHSKRILNSMMTWVHAENIYESSCVINSYNVFFSRLIQGSNNIWCSKSLIGCTECIACYDLQNQSYCIENEQYDKKIYFSKKAEYLSHIDYKNTISVDFEKTVLQSSDIEKGLFAFNVHRGRNVVFSGHEDGLTDVSDAFMASGGKDYAGVCHAAGDSEYVYCSVLQRKCFDTYYCYFCEYCTFCFGCVGLKNKEFCIYNKQYTKEERHTKVQEIFEKMEQEGTLGDFFPGSMCPFNFNDTAAALIEDFSKEEAIEAGFLWRNEEIKVDIPDRMEVVDVDQLSIYESQVEGKRKIDPSILKKVIKDESGNIYRVIKMEYDFLVKYGLPLPRKHRLKRLKNHFRA